MIKPLDPYQEGQQSGYVGGLVSGVIGFVIIMAVCHNAGDFIGYFVATPLVVGFWLHQTRAR